MSSCGTRTPRSGIDTVEIARIQRLLDETPSGQLSQLFTATELEDAGSGPGRAASLAARFAAKEACLKLFPRETALGTIQMADFGVRRNAYGAPEVEPSPAAQAVLDRHRLGNLRVTLTHTATSATALASADPIPFDVPWFGALFYHLFPFRRAIVLDNMRRVFGDTLPEPEIRRLAQAYCGHFIRFLLEWIQLPFMSEARRGAWVRVENMEIPIQAHGRGKGILLLVGHFGSWEVSTVAGIGQFPQYHGVFHFVRRPLHPALLNQLVTWRFKRNGFGTLSKKGSLERILELLEQGAIIVYVFDQHATGKDGVAVDFFGHPAGTFKSLAILAMNTGAPVIPAYSWRQPDGSHVLRFEPALPLVECEDTSEAIHRNTRTYNAALERMLLRHPEQWIWMHRRWKNSPS